MIIKLWNSITYYISDRIQLLRINHPELIATYPLITQKYISNSSHWSPTITITSETIIYYLWLFIYIIAPISFINAANDYNIIRNPVKDIVNKIDNQADIYKIVMPIPINNYYMDIPIIVYGRHISAISEYILNAQLRNIRDNSGRFMLVMLDNRDITTEYNKMAHYYNIFIADTKISKKKYLRKILLIELNINDVKDMHEYKLILTDKDFSDIEVYV